MTPVNDDRFTELAPDYALGVLEGEELEQFERHLAAGCVACERELASMDAVGDAMAYSLPVTPAPGSVRDRVLAAVEADLAASAAQAAALAAAPVTLPAGPAPDPHAPTAPPADAPAWGSRPPKPAAPDPVRRSWWARMAPAVAFAALLATALAGAMAWRLKGQLALVREDLERVQAENQALARVMDVVRSPRLDLVALGGQEAAPESQGRVLWSREDRKAVLYAYDLPRPPAGRDYQLWVIDGQTPRSEGVFPVDGSGRATHVLPELPAAEGVGAFAVTLEPAGGVPQPTGAMYLLGAVPSGAH